MESILTYNGQTIEQRADGYVNATQMAKANDVLIGHWLTLKSTEFYIQELSSDIGIPISELTIIVKGGDSTKQGTWIHPLLALNFGRWISPKFAIWCDKHIKTLIETGKTEINPSELTRLQILEMAIESEKKYLAAQAKIEADADKVEFAEKVAIAKNHTTLGDFIKSCQIGRNTGFRILREMGIIQKYTPLPYQRYIDQDYFYIKIKVTDVGNGQVRQDFVTIVTPKGELFVHKKFAEFNQQEQATVQVESVLDLI